MLHQMLGNLGRYQLVLWLVLSSFLSLNQASAGCGGCAKGKYVERYAYLFVTTEPAGAEVISANTGITLSDIAGTPVRSKFIMSKHPYRDEPISLFIYKPCFKPVIRRMDIDGWYRTEAEALKNPHTLHIRLENYQTCSP